MKNFTETLKSLILQSGKQQIALCHEMNISKQKLSNWKSGYTEPNLHDLILLANYFQCSIDYLLGLEDDFGNIVIKNEAPQLSAEELQILEAYRELTPPGKKLVKQTIETLHATSMQSKQKKTV